MQTWKHPVSREKDTGIKNILHSLWVYFFSSFAAASAFSLRTPTNLAFILSKRSFWYPFSPFISSVMDTISAVGLGSQLATQGPKFGSHSTTPQRWNLQPEWWQQKMVSLLCRETHASPTSQHEANQTEPICLVHLSTSATVSKNRARSPNSVQKIDLFSYWVRVCLTIICHMSHFNYRRWTCLSPDSKRRSTHLEIAPKGLKSLLYMAITVNRKNGCLRDTI